MTLSGLERLLAAWLPSQRWFAGGGTVHGIEVSSDVQLADGDPELRHLIADVQIGQERISYQVLVGIRSILPPEFAESRIGALPDGRVAYDGAMDPELTAVLLDGIATGRQVGPIRFAAEPGAVIDHAVGRTMPPVHSNTSVIFGDRAILKLLRRPYRGRHPDLEVPAALARAGSKLVAAPLGWIELSGSDPEPAVLAIVSEYLTGASDGWSLATASVRAPRPDFAGQAGLLGEATARLHAELAAAFGTSVLPPDELADLAADLTVDLTDAVAVVPGLAAHQRAIAACYAQLATSGTTVQVQRIHGDYHLGQVLRGDGGWVVLDFEGEPSVPLAKRRAPGPALRDVAGMLRSFDYAARHQALRHSDDQDLQARVSTWVDHCQQAFCDGYARVSGTDPGSTDPLLRALVLSKAVYEAVYEVRHRPDWLPIPLAALAEESNDSRR